MSTYKIRVVNSDFEAREEVEGGDIEAARLQSLRGVLRIGSDELCKGATNFFGAEVSIEFDGEVKERFMVAMGHSPLQ